MWVWNAGRCQERNLACAFRILVLFIITIMVLFWLNMLLSFSATQSCHTWGWRVTVSRAGEQGGGFILSESLPISCLQEGAGGLVERCGWTLSARMLVVSYLILQFIRCGQPTGSSYHFIPVSLMWHEFRSAPARGLSSDKSGCHQCSSGMQVTFSRPCSSPTFFFFLKWRITLSLPFLAGLG